MSNYKATDALLGLAIGDALGVPFEFKSSLEMQLQPATRMVGHGTHHQPIGTWSDDSSLSFCLAASLLEGYELKDIAQRFIAWKEENYWTAWDNVFDIGRTTSRAIQQLSRENLKSGGYVLETIEASLWAFLTTSSYEDAVLTVINLGHDTDTTGAITGGLAGLYYGQENIPSQWLASLVKLEEIVELGNQLSGL